jgi:high-affinity iron transporter
MKTKRRTTFALASVAVLPLALAGCTEKSTASTDDITAWFNWSSWYGEVIQGIFNVTPTPTVLQLVSWSTYLVVVLALFLRPVKALKTPARTRETSADSTPSPERSTT